MCDWPALDETQTDRNQRLVNLFFFFCGGFFTIFQRNYIASFAKKFPDRPSSYNCLHLFFHLTGTVKEIGGTEEIATETGIVSVTGNVTVTKIVNVTGNVTEIVIATVTAKRNVGSTEVGHEKKTVIVTVIATVTGEKIVFVLCILCE